MYRHSGLGLVAAGIAALLMCLCLQLQPIPPPATDLNFGNSSILRQVPVQALFPDVNAVIKAVNYRPAYRPLLPRDTTWIQAVAKGNAFICIWQGAEVAQSEFLSFGDLEKWGWSILEALFDFEDEPGCKSCGTQRERLTSRLPCGLSRQPCST